MPASSSSEAVGAALAASPQLDLSPPRAFPSLYQVNTRVLLSSRTRELRRTATLDDIPDTLIDQIAERGFDWVWFLGVWQTGEAGRKVSLDNPEWLREYRRLLPDFCEKDVCGSCFAICAYNVHSDFGGRVALQRLRKRLRRRGLRLLLDFVPNHMAPDHPWVQTRPQHFVHGTEEQLQHEPQNYTKVSLSSGPTVIAYGRDPYFSGWPDTIQLNYANPQLQEAMSVELEKIAEMCDGIRCDMAMLILPDVFERTWHLRPSGFWPSAIARTRARHPGFLFMAEVYWGLEWTLQQQGFDYTYDKTLYDRLRAGHARPVRDHFRADMNFQRHSARFLENHDEPRAAATFPLAMHKAAAVLTFLCPGLRFIHQGQLEGATAKIPVHLNRCPAEPTNRELSDFYLRLLSCIRHPAAHGDWQLLESRAAWNDNWTWDCYVAFAWHTPNQPSLIVPVNYAPNQSQCYLAVPPDQVSGQMVRFRDLMSSTIYDRDGDEIATRGLYLDMPPWGYHVFEMTTQPKSQNTH